MKLLALLGVVVGCGGGNDLDCAYLASADNCFKTTASAAASCLPPEGARGVLAPDHASCTYATGQVITFTPPLVLPLDFDAPWSFTVTTNGEPCLSYSDDDDGFVLTVGGETVSETVSGRSLELSCPDGTSFSNDNALELLSCPGDNFGDLPGNTSSSSSSSVQFGLINTGLPTTLTVFDCGQ